MSNLFLYPWNLALLLKVDFKKVNLNQMPKIKPNFLPHNSQTHIRLFANEKCPKTMGEKSC